MHRLAERGMTMVVVTMKFSLREKWQNRVMFLDKGCVVEEGEAREVLTQPKSDRLNTFLSRMRQAQMA